MSTLILDPVSKEQLKITADFLTKSYKDTMNRLSEEGRVNLILDVYEFWNTCTPSVQSNIHEDLADLKSIDKTFTKQALLLQHYTEYKNQQAQNSINKPIFKIPIKDLSNEP